MSHSSVFKVTFIGHQGWQFSTGTTSILVDAVLGHRLGHQGGSGLVYPPREMDLSALPPLDGIFLTHEHDDHFDIPTLFALDRKIPVYLSGRSSLAARTIIREMGFDVQLLSPGMKVQIEDLEFIPLSPRHENINNMDEWDVIPFVVRDTQGHGSFFSSVDVQPDRALLEQLKRHEVKPGIWCYTNNCADWSCLHIAGSKAHTPLNNLSYAAVIANQHRQLQSQGPKPVFSVICGGGWSFSDDRQFLNNLVFNVDSSRVCEGLNLLEGDQHFKNLCPGESLSMHEGAVAGRSRNKEKWIRVVDEADWPDRSYLPTQTPIAQLQPACGQTEFPEKHMQQLRQRLDEFARHLYGRRLFEQLYSLPAEEFDGLKPGPVLVLRAGQSGEAYVLAYDPQSAAFVPVTEDDPANTYISGVECWATDLLKLLNAQITLPALCFGRIRFWNMYPSLLRFSQKEFWIYQHPLRHPDRYLDLYRTIYHGLLDNNA